MSSPRIAPRPLPRITPNASYAEDGSPLTRFETLTYPSSPIMDGSFEMATRVSVRPLPNGLIAVGDVS